MAQAVLCPHCRATSQLVKAGVYRCTQCGRAFAHQPANPSPLPVSSAKPSGGRAPAYHVRDNQGRVSVPPLMPPKSSDFRIPLIAVSAFAMVLVGLLVIQNIRHQRELAWLKEEQANAPAPKPPESEPLPAVQPEKAKKMEKPIAVSAEELMDDYDRNRLAADQKYLGRWLIVHGKVANIRRDDYGPYVVLSTGFTIESLHCYFPVDSDEPAKVSKGQEVKILGLCQGKSFNVWLKSCKLR